MSLFDISEARVEELVLIAPRYLVLHKNMDDAAALRVASAAAKIAKKRWPRAYVKIATKDNYDLDDSALGEFILVEHGSKVGRDFDFEVWNYGPRLKLPVAQKILAKAIRLAEPKTTVPFPSLPDAARLKRALAIAERIEALQAELVRTLGNGA